MENWKKACIPLLVTAGILLMAVRAEAATVAEPGTETISGTDTARQEKGNDFIHTEEMGADYYLEGVFDSCTGYFHTGEWEIESISFVMNYAISQLLNKEVSYYTIYLNQEPVYTGTFAEEQGQTGEVTVELPSEAVLDNEVNGITVETYLRREGGEECVDDAATACWMNLFAESRVEIHYEARNQAATIAEFYRKFTSVEAMDYKQSMIAVQEGADGQILTAMAQILAGISRNAVTDYQNIQCSMIKSSEEMGNYPYTIYLCKMDELTEGLKAQMSNQQKQLAEEEAVICLLPLENGGKLLLITGNNPDRIAASGKILSNASYMAQFQTDTAGIFEEDSYLMEKESAQQYSLLTEYGVQVKGLFGQEASFAVEYPAGRRLAVSSQLSLDFRYSSNLNFEKSLLSVFVNDVPIGSRRLSEEGCDGSTEVFDIPVDLQITGDFVVKVVFDLQIGDDWCELTPEEAPWGYVEDTSMLKLASTDNLQLSFDSFPSPFVRDGQMNKVFVILPDKPENVHIQAMGKLLLTMGRYLKNNRGILEVGIGSNMDGLPESNLIIIGKTEEINKLTKDGIKTVFTYTDLENVKEKEVLPAYAGISSGYAQLSENPWSESFYGILLLSSNDEEGLLCPLKYLGDTQQLWKLSGGAFLTDGDSIFTIQAAEEVSEAPVPVTEDEEAEPHLTDSPVLYAVVFVLLAMLAGGMLLLRIWKERSGNER